MILCVTPNPAIDRTLLLSSLTPGAVLRPEEVIASAGGKGLNVARSLRVLGEAARCCGPIGGHHGRLLAELAEAEGLPGAWTTVGGETRVCTILVDRSTGASTGIYERGEPLGHDAWGQVVAEVEREAGAAGMACVCGSLPAGLAPEAMAQLVTTIQAAGRPVWVDSSGAALAAASRARPAGVKVNHEELGELLGTTIDSLEGAAAAARSLLARGVGQAAITLGRRGAILASPAGCWQAAPPAIQAVSPVGSGDAFFAGLLHGLARGWRPAEALRAGVAAGAANTLRAGAGRFSRAEFEAALQATTARELSV
jgi:1-phosphofructokinase family hexose kinase